MASARAAPYATENDQAVYQARQKHAKAPWEKEANTRPTGRMVQRVDQRVKPPPYATSMDVTVSTGSGPTVAVVAAAGSSGSGSALAAAGKTSAPWERDENRFRSRIGVVPGTWSNLAPYATDRSPRQQTISSPAKDQPPSPQTTTASSVN